MKRTNRWPLMIFLLPFIFGCNPIQGIQEAREKANREGRMILENIDGYAQKAAIAAQKSERVCFSFMRELFQIGRSSETESDMGLKKSQEKKEESRNEKDFDRPFNDGGFIRNAK